MPGNSYYPIPALASTFDARQWSGLPLFDRGSDTVTMPSFGARQGVYEDVLSFLNGRGSLPGEDLQSRLTAAADAAFADGAYTIQLLSTDRLRIENDKEAFALEANADNATYGAPVAGVAAVNVGGTVHRLDLPADWLRGNIAAGVQLVINPTTGANFNLPDRTSRYQDLVTMLRKTGAVGDADDMHDPAGDEPSLEAVDNDACSTTTTRWGVDARGHVWWSALSVTPDAQTPVWTSTTFRDRLGFSGRETTSRLGFTDQQIADFPCPGLYVPTRQLARPLELQTDEVSDAMRLDDGTWAGQHRGTFVRWLATIHVDGPQDSRSTWLHWARRVLPYLPQGAPCTLYLEWGDPRRRIEPYGLVSGVSAYSLLHTSEMEGARGRIRGSMLGDLQRTLTRSGRTARRFPLSFVVEERP